MGCCTSTDRKVELLFEKFQIVSLANLHSNNSQNIPVLVCGRIMPVNEVLICPVKERQCIYYETKVFRHESGKGKHSRGKWFLEFTETEWRDFYLYDPQNPQMKLYIPARQNRMIVRGVDDGRAASGKHGSLLQSEQLPNGIQQLLNRHNYKVEGNLLMLKLKKYMNYVEESYDINEQIACLGFIQDGIDAMGQPVKMMHPIQTQSIPESYFQENHWERADINLLKELCKPSSIVSTDDRRLFRGIEIMMPQVIQPPMMQQVTQVPMMPQVVQGVIIQQPPQYQQPVQYQQPPQYPPVQYPPPQYQQPVQYPPQYQPQYQQPVQYPPQYQQPVQGYYPIAQQMNGEICQPLEVDCPPPPVMKNT